MKLQSILKCGDDFGELDNDDKNCIGSGYMCKENGFLVFL